MGVSANLLTILGLITAFFSGILIWFGDFFAAAAVLMLTGILDLFDGAVARSSKTNDAFGGILDSSLDRYGDGFIFFGILLYALRHGNFIYALLSMSALLGAFSISYVRARAECDIDLCKVGFWERGERIVYVFFGLFFHNLRVVLWVLGIGTHLTFIRRLLYAKGKTSGKDVSKNDLQGHSRNKIGYYVKCAILFLMVVLIKKT